MKNNYGKFNKLFAVILCIVLLTACSTNNQTTLGETSSTGGTNVISENNVNVENSSTKLFEYDDEDYYKDWADQIPSYIKLNGSEATVEGLGVTVNDNVIKISEAGVYVINGKLNDGQIIVDSEDKDTVRLVLNGAEIDCSDNSPLYIINAGKVVISLEDGTENTVSDGENYVLVDPTSDEPNSAIYSKADLTINGTGTLTVVGNYNNCITSKDDLRVTGGNIVINSKDDGILGKDAVAIKDGSFVMNVGGKGIKSTNDEDTEVGNIYLEGGNFSIVSTDDAIHSANEVNISNGEFTISTEDDGINATTSVNISGGAIDIKKSYEGIEGNQITISDGDINVVSSDDGINVSSSEKNTNTGGMPGENSSNSDSDVKLTISGGNITVNASGDGLDANGSIYMTGGNVTVFGPTNNGNGALDYDRECNITGGTLLAVGSSGMAQTPSDTSTQNSVMVNFSQIQKSNSKVYLKDSDGNIILTVEPEKEFQSLLMSSSNLKLDKSYTLVVDDSNVVTFTLSKSTLKISDTGEEITGGSMMPGRNGGGKMTPGVDGSMPAPDGTMPNQGERPIKRGNMDGTSQATPPTPGGDTTNTETESTNN